MPKPPKPHPEPPLKGRGRGDGHCGPSGSLFFVFRLSTFDFLLKIFDFPCVYQYFFVPLHAFCKLTVLWL